MSLAEHDPLLQPSLTESDDAQGFARPWDPSTLGWLALLVGPFGSGLLMWLNQRRLGLRGGAHLLLVMALVGAVVMVVGIFFLPSQAEAAAQGMTEQRRDSMRIVRFVGNAVALPLAWWFLGEQRRRYRIAEQVNAPTSALFLPGLGAFVVNLAVTFAVGLALVAIKRA